MGGDEAPGKIIDGVVEAVHAFKSQGLSHTLIVTGVKTQIQDHLRRCHSESLLGDSIEIVHTDEVIGMHESPTSALTKKPRSSMHVGMELVKKGEADGFVSMGNTGAVMAVALVGLGRIEGVARPTIGAFFPTLTGKTLVLDVGTNVDCKPLHLLQFGLMGSIYMNAIMNIEDPRVGLLSIGEEASKGDDLTVKSHDLFKQKALFDFIGNVEGRDILKGAADIVVCDGFVGNVVLKFGESIYHFLKSRIKETAHKSTKNALIMGIAKPALRNVFRELDYQEYGGVPLLGVNGVVIIGHGSSSPKALSRAIMVAKEMAEKRINEVIRQRIQSSKE